MPDDPGAPTDEPTPRDEPTSPPAEPKAKPDDQPAAPSPPPASADDPPRVPERYELDSPEGYDVNLEEFGKLARRLELDNAGAQTMLEGMADFQAAQQQQFRDELMANTEVGGGKLTAVTTRVESLLDRFMPADTELGRRFRDEMNRTGYGNWEPWVVLADRFARALSEDRPAGSNMRPPTPERKPWEKLYGEDKAAS